MEWLIFVIFGMIALALRSTVVDYVHSYRLFYPSADAKTIGSRYRRGLVVFAGVAMAAGMLVLAAELWNRLGNLAPQYRCSGRFGVSIWSAALAIASCKWLMSVRTFLSTAPTAGLSLRLGSADVGQRLPAGAPDPDFADLLWEPQHDEIAEGARRLSRRWLFRTVVLAAFGSFLGSVYMLFT